MINVSVCVRACLCHPERDSTELVEVRRSRRSRRIWPRGNGSTGRAIAIEVACPFAGGCDELPRRGKPLAMFLARLFLLSLPDKILRLRMSTCFAQDVQGDVASRRLTR